MRVLLPFTSLIILLVPILSFAQEGIVASNETDVYAGGPDAPVVSSDTYINKAAWYRPQDVTFSWELDGNITAVAAELHNAPGEEPQKSYRPAISEITFTADDFTEGTQYLTVQLRNNEKWGAFTDHVIKIDNTPPEPFVVVANTLKSERPALVLTWEATDTLSGIDFYTVQINNNAPETLTLAEVKSGYLLDVDPNEQYNLSVSAYDKAGNSRTIDTLLVPTIPPSALSTGAFGKIADDAASLLVAIMSAVMLLLFGYLIYERQRYARQLKLFKKEANDIHNQLLRIFTALRFEIHDQIRGITSKKRLNKGEKEAVDGLHKALTVSEMLLEREIQDVKDLADQ